MLYGCVPHVLLIEWIVPSAVQGGHKVRLTPTTTSVHQRLPSKEDIQLEKKGQQVEHLGMVSTVSSWA